ncbi:ABC transporter substrate-binding protein [Metallumcola ferriviriculae]|uniref:ABC transporter substrate-binding protein n=1 Tax=Metallumcola ferriviriculae TaxID=3039180 RepID=A0AAU0UR93_9FIRM|nr:ABC transporter substrate-binding protein [Desulfitibacteraceae bacterium MK1]
MRINSWIIMLTVLLLTVGCTRPAEPPKSPQPQSEKQAVLTEVKIASTEEIGSLDPLKINSPMEFQIAQAIYQGLVEFDESTRRYQPLLAEKFTDNEDGTGLIFTIKSGIAFQDGTPLDAEVVRASLERWLTSYQEPWLSPIDVVKVEDNYTLLLTWRRSKEEMLAALAGPRASVLSAGKLENPGFQAGTYFEPTRLEAGTGPYFVQEWADGQWITLAANKKYQGDLPAVERWEIWFNYLPEDALTDMQSRRVDMVQGLDQGLLTIGHEMNMDSLLKINKLSSGIFLSFNPVVFKEPAMRQSLAGLIDRREVSRALKGLHLPMYRYLPKTGGGVSVSDVVYPQGAAALLEAGLADLTWSESRQLSISIRQQTLAQLEDKGILVEPVEQDKVADLRLIIWTEPYQHPNAVLELWQRHNLEKGTLPRGVSENSREHIELLSRNFAAQSKLIPLLALRQALYVRKIDVPLSDWGYLDLASYHPADGE